MLGETSLESRVLRCLVRSSGSCGGAKRFAMTTHRPRTLHFSRSFMILRVLTNTITLGQRSLHLIHDSRGHFCKWICNSPEGRIKTRPHWDAAGFGAPEPSCDASESLHDGVVSPQALELQGVPFQSVLQRDHLLAIECDPTKKLER